MKRILLTQNNILLADICSDLHFYEKTFKSVSEAYSELELGELTPDVFNQIVTGDADAIITQYKASLEEQLANTLVKNTKLKRIVLEGTEESILNFLHACGDFLNTDTTPNPSGRHKFRSVFLSITDLSFKGGGLFISEDSKELLLERYCRIYVETEREYLIHQALLKMQSGLQEFRNALFSLELPMNVYDMDGGPGYLLDHHINEFFTCKIDRKVNIKPTSIKWAAGYKAEVERRNNR